TRGEGQDLDPPAGQKQHRLARLFGEVYHGFFWKRPGTGPGFQPSTLLRVQVLEQRAPFQEPDRFAHRVVDPSGEGHRNLGQSVSFRNLRSKVHTSGKPPGSYLAWSGAHSPLEAEKRIEGQAGDNRMTAGPPRCRFDTVVNIKWIAGEVL